ncbi:MULTISPECIES: transglycosylase domain-containing protein [unclassified Streptomyces]|uniref:transglycosylase domain-containing protein n=1 Tax=unclassified Streptomyces TaxID=2593676 RepID=UPI00224CDB69|nr:MULTISPECIES: transglycosylase domain-containing protein [unclassified Streptomyces]MCX4988720.1 penicillin-binding protein [Streptomyces sp. NBC_00568]MCX5006058.1 penicillin-binding protein [Streptomyces sp. NBC_00638]
MGRAEERRARQAQGRRAAPQSSSGHQSAAPGATGAKAGGKPKRTGIRRFVNWKSVLGTFLGVCLLGMGAFIVLYMVVSVPEGNAAAKRQSNIYKYSNGDLLGRTGKVNREIVDLSKVPQGVQKTFVAAENKSFYKDSGVDLKGTARGLINTLSGKGKQGGSTITQQYVKNYYLSQDQTVTRKLKELVISLKVDRKKSKDDILAGYINTSYYGRNAYGIQAAAQAYYQVDAGKLKVEQGAYLASLLQAPSQYDWAVASKTGKRLVEARWNYTLDNMVEQGWLDSGKRAGMKFPVPKDPKGAPGMEGQTGYLVFQAEAELAKQLVAQGTAADLDDAHALIDAGGWTITLNIDKKKQTLLEKTVKQQLTSKLDPKKRKVDANIQAGAVSVDPKTGKVLAMYGGKDYFKHYLNNATRRDYQAASTFKPLILAAALAEEAKTRSGRPIAANTIYDGTSRRPVVGSSIAFAPPNEDEHNYGPVTVQTAMNKSINSVFAQMGVDVGMDEVLKVAGELGMNTKGLQAVPAQTLGSMGASPLEMAGVYATLDNHGKKVTPAIVASAVHKDRTVQMPDPTGERVISEEAADTVTSVLTGVVDDGTARVSVRNNPNRNGQQVAGKTGTSDNNKSAWFTGYTPNLVTSVLLFGEDAKNHNQVSMKGATGLYAEGGRVNGGGYPAQIWAAYTFQAMGGKVTEFDLNTTSGAAVEPTDLPTVTESPSSTPSSTPTTEEPSSEPPTSSSPPTPTDEPTTTEPTTTSPSTPTGTPTDGIPDNPFDRDNSQ